MDELITLNQLKEYDAEKTNKLNVRFDNVYDYVNIEANNVYNYVDNGFNNVNNQFNDTYNYIDNSINNVNLDVANLGNTVNDIHNELNETHNNFTTLNFSASNATVTDLNVSNAVVNSLDVDTVSINGVVGNNGQVLGVVNGKSEWMDIPGLIDADNVYINNLYINNQAKINGFDVTSYTIMAEDDYNNLGDELRNQAFYVTSPNGNMYLHGILWSPSYVPTEYTAYVDLPDLAISSPTITTSTLTFTSGAVANNFVRGGTYNGIWKKTPLGEGWDNSGAVGTQANTGSIITNAQELYIINAARMYMDCSNLVDTFICNPALIINAPINYSPLKYCTNMVSTFSQCDVFNQPVTIGNSVINMVGTFSQCEVFNQPVTIGNSVINMASTFYNCRNFNQPVTIPDSVINMSAAFRNCERLTEPIILGNNVADAGSMFEGCIWFNQPMVFGDNVYMLRFAFKNCLSFNKPITIKSVRVEDMSSMLSNSKFRSDVHINHLIELGNTSNYIYNMLVNGGCGKTIEPGHILNDA